MAGSHPTVVGPYVIVRVLGHGRLGDLYLAVDAMLDRQVALRMLPELSAESRGRFARDARRRASLQHAAIAPIYMVGEHESRLYFARPFIAGRTFEQIVSAKTKMPVGLRIEWMATVCDALAYAYGVGYASLALRSAEIVVSDEGAPTLLDIGLPQIADAPAPGDRATSYRSPEELRGADPDQRSDVFVAGALLHELIAYEKPFGDGSDAEILLRIEAGEPRAPADSIPPGVAAIVTKALQPDPAARQQTFQDLAAELRRALRSLGADDSSLPPPLSAPARPRLPIDAARLESRRAALIEQHLAGSREALQREDFDGAVALAEQAALLDADDPRTAELLRLIEAGRIERETARLVAEAQRRLDQGVLDEAAGCIERALAIGPTHVEAQRVRTAIEKVRREQSRAQSAELLRCSMDELRLGSDAKAGRRIDDNVRFTVYRPAVMVPERWHPLLLFTHLSDRRPDAPPGEMHPVARVEAEAARELGPAVASFPRIVQEAGSGIPHEALVRIKPSVAGLVFNPPEYSFLWTESVHRAEFKVRAASSLDGRTARGTIEVYVGAISVALITLAIPIDGRAPAAAATTQDVARPYRRIFASYSHKDTAIVRQFASYARGIGDSYMRDVVDLRAGELWDDRLMAMIEEADVFQLFWSTNSMRSPFVRREWEHALTVDKSHFVRGLYWESPFPEGHGLPPPQLRARHFASVAIAGDGSDAGPDATQDTMASAQPPRPALGLALEVISSHGEPLPQVTRKVFGGAGGTVGRTKASDFVLAHTNVSRTHARISCDDGAYYIEDTSTNGLYLNSPGNRLERGKRYPLHAGDRLFLDPYELVVSIVSELERTAADPPSTASSAVAADDPFLVAHPAAPAPPPPAAREVPVASAPPRLPRYGPPTAREPEPSHEAVEARVRPVPAAPPAPLHPPRANTGAPLPGVPAARPFSSAGMIVIIALAILVALAVALVFALR